jgi:hypothetical protein
MQTPHFPQIKDWNELTSFHLVKLLRVLRRTKREDFNSFLLNFNRMIAFEEKRDLGEAG